MYDTNSSSKSSYGSSTASVSEEDDASSQFADNSLHDTEDDRTSNSDADSDDITEKIKWFFLNVEQPEEAQKTNTTTADSKMTDANEKSTIEQNNNLSEPDTNASEPNESSSDSLLGKRKRDTTNTETTTTTKHFKITSDQTTGGFMPIFP